VAIDCDDETDPDTSNTGFVGPGNYGFQPLFRDMRKSPQGMLSS
jgi:hypothetical protein